jgi:hypothetical protein
MVAAFRQRQRCHHLSVTGSLPVLGQLPNTHLPELLFSWFVKMLSWSENVGKQPASFGELGMETVRCVQDGQKCRGRDTDNVF